MENKKKSIIIVSIILIFIIGLIIILLLNKKDNGKIVLVCDKQTEETSGKHYMNYEIVQYNNYIKLISINKIEISDNIKQMLLKKGYTEKDIEYFYEESGKPKLEESFSSVREYVEYDIQATSNFIEISTIYTVNSTNKEQFKQLIGYDLYSLSIEDLKQLYESGGLTCKKG